LPGSEKEFTPLYCFHFICSGQALLPGVAGYFIYMLKLYRYEKCGSRVSQKQIFPG
jgi:hypothetical protein